MKINIIGFLLALSFLAYIVFFVYGAYLWLLEGNVVHGLLYMIFAEIAFNKTNK